MHYCFDILILLFLIVLLYNQWEMKQIIKEGSGSDEVVSIDGLIKKLENMTTQIKGFIK